MAKFIVKDVEIREVAGRTPTEYFVWGHLQDPKNKFATRTRTFTCFNPTLVAEVRSHIGATKKGTITDEEASKPEHKEALDKILTISPAAIEEFIFAEDAEGINKYFVSLAAGSQTERTIPLDANKRANTTSDGTLVVKDRTTVVAQYEWVMVPDPNNIVIDEDGELVCNKVKTDELGRPVSQYKDGFSPRQLGESVRNRLWISVPTFLATYPTLADKMPDFIKDMMRQASQPAPATVVEIAQPAESAPQAGSGVQPY